MSQYPSDVQINTEAVDWFVQLRDPSVSAAHREQFCGWLFQSPHHMYAYLDVIRSWTCLDCIGGEIARSALVRSARDPDDKLH
jgi:ferric-dicitrate binding protein FerR (iron transport regulator)